MKKTGGKKGRKFSETSCLARFSLPTCSCFPVFLPPPLFPVLFRREYLESSVCLHLNHGGKPNLFITK